METYNICVIGDRRVGKTTVVKTVSKDKVSEQSPMNIFVSPYRHHFLEWWDFSGNPKYTDLRHSFYKFFHGYVLVFDLSNRNSFKNLKKWEKDIRPFTNAVDVPILIVGTKEDKGISERLNRKYTIVSQGKYAQDDWDQFFSKVTSTDTQKIKQLNNGEMMPNSPSQSLFKNLTKLLGNHQN